MSLDLEKAMHLLARTHKPDLLAKDSRGDLWDFISYPWVKGDRIAVLNRVPGRRA